MYNQLNLEGHKILKFVIGPLLSGGHFELQCDVGCSGRRPVSDTEALHEIL